MNKKCYALLILMLFLVTEISAQVNIDSILLAMYQKDSANFRAFPDCILLDSITPNKEIKQWELNRVNGYNDNIKYVIENVYKPRNSSISFFEYRNSHKPENGFGTICPPTWCFWYILAKKDSVYNISGFNLLSDFIGTIDNPYDAYFWLISHDLGDSRILPLKIEPKTRYRKIRNGYLIEVSLMVSDCPITNADLLYFVGKDKKIRRLFKKITFQGKGCI
jgi:hypothetical protein